MTEFVAMIVELVAFGYGYASYPRPTTTPPKYMDSVAGGTNKRTTVITTAPDD